MNGSTPVVALTQGDPSGIGPDITLMAWLRREQLPGAFAAVGDPALFVARARQLGLDVPVAETDFAGAAARFARALPVVRAGSAVRGEPGSPTAEDAVATLAAIDASVEAVHRGDAAAVVTNPIAKHVLHAAGFIHPGHTEYLGALAHRWWGVDVRPVMLLWSEALAVVPVTIHVPIRDVPQLLTKALLVETALTVHRAMRTDFGLNSPRIVCAGLNPHAGEEGSIGRDEIDVIRPALDELRASGVDVAGPLSADTLFHAEARAGYDVALTMYHDQGLIPIKVLSFDTGVNATLGLPFIRTSPDHGTAFALAGTGRAKPSSLMAAIGLAHRLVCARAQGATPG